MIEWIAGMQGADNDARFDGNKWNRSIECHQREYDNISLGLDAPSPPQRSGWWWWKRCALTI